MVLHEHFYLKTEDKNILLSSEALLNDRTIDAAQAIISKTLGIQGHYQSVLNCQNRIKTYKAMTQEHIQLLHDGHNHCFLGFCSNALVQICNSLNLTLTSNIEKVFPSLV